MLVLAGCGVSKRPPTPPPKPDGPSRTVHSGPGEATRRGPDRDRFREWDISWTGASLDIAPDGAVGGSMEGVNGVLYRDGVEASDFSADRADADPKTGVLVLVGHVKVVARSKEGASKGQPMKEGATLTCETLEWRARQNIVAAKGSVRIESKDAVVGPFPELWANGDLTVAGTPDWFQENNR